MVLASGRFCTEHESEGRVFNVQVSLAKRESTVRKIGRIGLWIPDVNRYSSLRALRCASLNLVRSVGGVGCRVGTKDRGFYNLTGYLRRLTVLCPHRRARKQQRSKPEQRQLETTIHLYRFPSPGNLTLRTSARLPKHANCRHRQPGHSCRFLLARGTLPVSRAGKTSDATSPRARATTVRLTAGSTRPAQPARERMTKSLDQQLANDDQQDCDYSPIEVTQEAACGRQQEIH